jgi:tetratricopeptide (TPR) repeat protein
VKRRAVATLAALVFGLGCASLAPRADSGIPPADAPAELDFLVGQELEMDGQLEEARTAYERALRKDPQAVFLLKRLAELSARTDHLTDALVYAERAFELDPDDEGLRLFLGSLYRLRRDPESAARVLRDDKGAPVSSDAAVLLFGILLEGERYPEAKTVAEWLIAHESEGVRGYIALAEVVERMGDAPGAEAVLRKGLAAHPGELALFGALARSRRERGDRVGEIGVYREILKIHRDHHATLLALADAQIALGQDKEANETLERIAAAYPDDLRTLLQLGFRSFEAGDFEAAESRFARALFAEGDFVEVYVSADVATCEGRDPKGLYQKARAGQIPEFTGISAPYEEPEAPELVLDTARQSPAESVAALIAYLEGKGYLSAPGRR